MLRLIVLRTVSEGRNPKGNAEPVRWPTLSSNSLSGTASTTVRSRSTRPVGAYTYMSSISGAARKLDSITRADVRAVLDRIEAPVAANRVHSIVRKFFNWAVENDLIANSPVAGIHPPNPETSRDRVLTDDELKAVWREAEKVGYPFGSILQFAHPYWAAAWGSHRHGCGPSSISTPGFGSCHGSG